MNTVHSLSLRLDEEQLPSFYTATDTVTDLVNIEHVGNRQQDPRSCLVHPVDCFDSEVWFSCNQMIFNVFLVFLVKSMQHLSEHMHFSSFLFPQVVQKHKLGEVGNKVYFDSLLSR